MSKSLREKVKDWKGDPFPSEHFGKKDVSYLLLLQILEHGRSPPSCFLSSLFYLAPHWRNILTKIILARRVLWTTEGKTSSVLTKKLKNGASMVHIAASLSITKTEQLSSKLSYARSASEALCSPFPVTSQQHFPIFLAIVWNKRPYKRSFQKKFLDENTQRRRFSFTLWWKGGEGQKRTEILIKWYIGKLSFSIFKTRKEMLSRDLLHLLFHWGPWKQALPPAAVHQVMSHDTGCCTQG